MHGVEIIEKVGQHPKGIARLVLRAFPVMSFWLPSARFRYRYSLCFWCHFSAALWAARRVFQQFGHTSCRGWFAHGFKLAMWRRAKFRFRRLPAVARMSRRGVIVIDRWVKLSNWKMCTKPQSQHRHFQFLSGALNGVLSYLSVYFVFLVGVLISA